MGFLLSAGIALIAFGTAARQWMRRSRKNRIDKYYVRLEEILTELQESRILEARLQKLDRELVEMRHKAFRQLVREQLQADDSFRIFQSLLAECQNLVRSRLPGAAWRTWARGFRDRGKERWSEGKSKIRRFLVAPASPRWFR